MSATTKYFQVMTDILDKIQSGEYKHHDLLPTEKQFQEEYSVSRITVRKALDALAAEGWVYKVQGKGTYASEPVKKGVDFTSVDKSCAQELRSRGFTVKRVLRRAEVVTCDRCTAEKYGLLEGEKYFIYERIYMGNDIPISYEKGYYRYSLFEGIEKHNLESESIAEILNTQYGYGVGHMRETSFRALIPDERVSRLMQLEKNTPLIQAEVNVYISEEGTNERVCAEFTKLFWRTDLVTINMYNGRF